MNIDELDHSDLEPYLETNTEFEDEIDEEYETEINEEYEAEEASESEESEEFIEQEIDLDQSTTYLNNLTNQYSSNFSQNFNLLSYNSLLNNNTSNIINRVLLTTFYDKNQYKNVISE